ncbi:MAG: OmpA family protein [Prevotellaceae bacterium]|jgi:outer membrane protein OmpA-like peptidoglycan-associated protein/opacity protein-like surface antigen|nr:OmpA family protein [Prevotellaceae bacterium]
MRKSISVFLMSCFVLAAVAQTSGNTSQVKYRSYFDFTRWSISLEGGLNAFDGDVTQYDKNFFESVRGKLSGGVALEHTFNPTVSLGLQYYYLPVQANSELRYREIEANKYQISEGIHHQGYLFASANLLRVFNKNITTHWGIWANIGLGAAYFNVDYWGFQRTSKQQGAEGYKCIVAPSAGANHADQPQIDDASTYFLDAHGADVHNAWAVIVPVGVNIEYNFTKNLALGLKFNYTSYNRDDLEGSKEKLESGLGLNYGGVTNDFIASGFVNLRWKFNSQRPHTRNITWREYDNEALATAQEALRKQTVMPKSYDDEIRNLQDQIDSIRGDIDQLREYMSPDGPDDDGDGVPNIRDLEPNTPPNVLVDFYGRTISEQGKVDQLPAVFFDFDKYNLDETAQQEVYKAAQLMKQNPNVLCEVRAYCDYVGSDKYNKQLSVNRANRVKEELVKVYGISADRIVANGNGRLLEPPSKYRINRRAEFHFSNE